jgi:palmitoyl transferase
LVAALLLAAPPVAGAQEAPQKKPGADAPAAATPGDPVPPPNDTTPPLTASPPGAGTAAQEAGGFWAAFWRSTPLGLSSRTREEAGFWARTFEGAGRISSDGRTSAIVSGYAWHLPWKHKTPRQKAFNSNAWGAGVARSFDESPSRQRLLYVIANNDSHQHMQYMAGYIWQHKWRPAGPMHLGMGYQVFVIGRNEYYYVPLPLMLPTFSAGFDRLELFSTYVPYGEVILFVGRFTF